MEDDGGRVGIRAPVLQPHAAIPLSPLVSEFRQVRRAPSRRTDFEQIGHTDNCPGCANARAGRKQAVGHAEQCRSRMEAILMTTTEGHERLERARDRFAQAAKEPSVEELQRKKSPYWRRGAASSATGIKSVPGRRLQQQLCVPKPRTAVVVAVKAQLTLIWDWWMCAQFSLKIPRTKVVVEVGLVPLDLTERDFSQADCRNICRKFVENSEPLLLIGSD